MRGSEIFLRIHSGGERGSRPGLHEVDELRQRYFHQLHSEDRTRGGAHTFWRVRITAIANQNNARCAGRVSSADNGSQIAGITNVFQGEPRAILRGVGLPVLLESGQHFMRIVLGRNLGHQLVGDDEGFHLVKQMGVFGGNDVLWHPAKVFGALQHLAAFNNK